MLNGGVRRVWNSGSGNTAYPSQNRITISGLDPAKEYNIYLASSQDPDVKCSWWVGTTGPQQFINNTTATRTPETWRPGDNWAVLERVVPDASGNIDVRGRGEAQPFAGAFSGLTLNGFQILEATGWLSPDKAIYDFGDPANNLGTSSSISDNNTGNDITWNVAFSANLSALSPTFTLADYATCSPVSGSTQDFSGGPVDYTVTAEDGSTKVYHVTAVPAATASSVAEMLTFEWGAYSGIITGTNVSLSVPPGTDVTTLDPICTLYPGATVSPLSGSTQDFTSPVAYTVTAEDGVTAQVYTVSVYESYSWVNAGGGSWSSSANWDPASIPTGSFSTALSFGTAGTYASSHDLGDSFQLSQLGFSGDAQVSLNGQSLAFGGAGPLLSHSGTKPVVILNALELGSDMTVAHTGTAQLTLGGVISGSNSLTKAGTGSARITGANTYSGGTTITGGRVDVDGPNIQWQSGSFGSNSVFGTGLVTASNATLGINRLDLANSFDLDNVVISSGNSFSSSINGPITVSGVVTILDTTTTGNIAYTGNISGTGDIVHRGTRIGSPTTLSGTNSYTGSTTIIGSLRFAQRVSLPLANWTADKLIVSPGSTAQFRVGGVGEFTSADIDTLAGLGNATGGFADGSFIGLDTGGGNFIYSGTLENTNGGANMLGLRLLGGRTLTLTGDNTYSGQTTSDNNSTLSVSSFNSVATNPALGTVHLPSSNLGAPTTVEAGTIVIGGGSFSGGTIVYTGAGEVTDRVLRMAGANNTTYRLDHSGTGLLKFVSDFEIGTDVRGPKIIDLRGSTSGIGEIAGAIFLGNADPANETRLTKSGTGTWILSGANEYTGATTVNQGTLALVGGSQMSPITVKSGAALGFLPSAPTISTAAVTFEAGSKIQILGTPAPNVYTLITASSIAGTPVLEMAAIDAGYLLEIVGGNEVRLIVPSTDPFAITGIVRNAGAGTVALTWNANPGKTYIAKYSPDMTDWGADMGDGLNFAVDEDPNDGNRITVTFNLVAFEIDQLGDLFFRIEEE